MITLKRLNVPALKHLRDVDLWLPRRGATLIEGPNESGKSTLFEAIYFALYGRPLVGEEPGKATLSSLIPHDGQQAKVTLILVAGETEMEVTRTLTRTRAGGPMSEATLTLTQPGRPVERINAVSAVSDRILAELRGLDGETLRNSCFMEQKGLERLESLRRDEREEAISRLLGLERLVSVERSLTPTAEERRRIERLREQAAVAKQRRMAQEATAREDSVAQRLQAAETRAWIEERDTLSARMDALAESGQRLSGETADNDAEIASIDTLRAAERRLVAAERLGWQAREAHQQTSLLTAQLKELDSSELVSPDEAAHRLEDIRRLENGLRELGAQRSPLQEAATLAQRAQAAEEMKIRAREALTRAESVRSATIAALARAQVRTTLADWVLARERVEGSLGQTQELTALRSEIGLHTREAAETRAQSWQWMALTWASLVMMLVSAALAIRFSIGPLWFFVVLAGIGVIGLGLRWRREISTSRSHRWKVSEAEQGITTVHAEGNLALRLVNDELGRLETKLRAAGLPIPASAAEGERLLHDLPATGDADGVETDAHGADAQATRARIELERANSDAEGAYSALSNLGFDADYEQIHQRLAEIDASEQTMIEEARALDLPEDLPGLAAARGGAEVRFAAQSDSAGNRDDIHTRLLASSDSLQELLESWATELQSVAQELERVGALDTFTLPVPMTSPAMEESHESLAERLHGALEQHDEPAVRARNSSLIAERERLTAQSSETREQYERLRGQIGERLTALGATAQGDESLPTLTTLWPTLGQASPEEEATLRAERDKARLDAYHSEQSTVERERETMLEGAELDEGDLRAQLTSAERDLRIRTLAADLASEARARIIRRALPETEAYMRAILPELTAGRYHDVTLLRDDGTGSLGETDIAIRMWDQQAGRFVRKNLFSGGARDQASLALRLAFALATLPKELGATPGFIFLDEPLSAFDAERSQALTRVLTSGAIADAFSQVFLISHSQVTDADLFDYILRMDGGRVAETNLPTGELAESLWEAESNVGAEARLGTPA